MNVNISFDTDNEAFEDSLLMEVTRVLRRAKDGILDAHNNHDENHSVYNLRDSNGNTIGTVTVANRTTLSAL